MAIILDDGSGALQEREAFVTGTEEIVAGHERTEAKIAEGMIEDDGALKILRDSRKRLALMTEGARIAIDHVNGQNGAEWNPERKRLAIEAVKEEAAPRIESVLADHKKWEEKLAGTFSERLQDDSGMDVALSRLALIRQGSVEAAELQILKFVREVSADDGQLRPKLAAILSHMIEPLSVWARSLGTDSKGRLVEGRPIAEALALAKRALGAGHADAFRKMAGERIPVIRTALESTLSAVFDTKRLAMLNRIELTGTGAELL